MVMRVDEHERRRGGRRMRGTKGGLLRNRNLEDFLYVLGLLF